MIHFENIETANASAQDIFVTDSLDLSGVDITTFSLGRIVFGDTIVEPLPDVIPFAGTNEYNTTVDLRPGNDLLVQINVRLDPNTGVLKWQLISIDPATGLPPTDPFAGFLPPNTNPPTGEGYVTFTVNSNPGALTGKVVNNQASIVFDVNPAMSTPVWFNTIDNTPPTSKVDPLPETTIGVFTLSWNGSDADSGIQDFSILVSDNGGEFTPWLTNTTQTSAPFIGLDGHTYAFKSVARDNVGNIEPGHNLPDTSTVFIAVPSDVSRQVSVTLGAYRLNRATKRYVQNVTLKNIGGTTITGPISLVLDNLSSNATLFNKTGDTLRATPAGSPYLNVQAGDLAPGASVTATLEFDDPTKATISYSTRVLAGSGNR